jgi:DNA invertase Pin-like site-specific DNA recombinase
MTITTAERAGIWVRVSSGGQDEQNQLPAVEAHCAQRGYAIKRRYELHDKSASKGEQQAAQDQVLADIRAGVIEVVVC